MTTKESSNVVFSFTDEPNCDAGVVLTVFKRFVRDFEKSNNIKLNFNLAEIRLDMSKISPRNRKSPYYFPLIVYDTKNNITARLAEFRVGYRGYSVDKLIECLEYLGFELRSSVVNTIYNKQKVNITLWKEEEFNSY